MNYLVLGCDPVTLTEPEWDSKTGRGWVKVWLSVSWWASLFTAFLSVRRAKITTHKMRSTGPGIMKKGKVGRAEWAVWGADQISNLQESCKLIWPPPASFSPLHPLHRAGEDQQVIIFLSSLQQDLILIFSLFNPGLDFFWWLCQPNIKMLQERQELDINVVLLWYTVPRFAHYSNSAIKDEGLGGGRRVGVVTFRKLQQV